MLLFGLKEDPEFGKIGTKLLVSCNTSEGAVGGLFLLDFQNNRWKKLYEGDCRGFCQLRDRLIVATSAGEIVAINRKNYRKLLAAEPRPLQLHGMAALNDQVVLIVETADNTIGCYDSQSLARLGEIRLAPAQPGLNQVNDIWLEGHILYMSMFTATGNWRPHPEQRTGCIAALDVSRFDPHSKITFDPKRHVVANAMYMPHSVMIHNGELAYCDSMSFRTIIGQRISIPFQGFTRGLAIFQDFAFIGQSRVRHLFRVPDDVPYINMDCGIHVYHLQQNISRFIPLEAQSVYQIRLYEEK